MVGRLRVIGGQARGRKLYSVPGDITRPITDRAKEALFGILSDEVRGARVLDLFAGTGAVGIEALSRGAAWCTFTDRSRAAVRTVRRNLEQTDLGGKAEVLRRDAFRFLRRLPDEPYDIVYIAPPQYHGMWRRALEMVDAAPGWLARSGLVVVQIHPREDEPLTLQHLQETDRRTYGSVQLQFYELREVRDERADAQDGIDNRGEL
jgi:16S rRNA (guanine(966)-N(2))-methyltransferase RsmD